MATIQVDPTAVGRPAKSATRGLRPGTGIWGWILRIALAIVFSFPLLFMFVSSLKPDQQIFGDLSSIAAFLPVGHLSFDNYGAVFDRVPAARFLINSVGVSVVTVVLGVIINWYNFAFRYFKKSW